MKKYISMFMVALAATFTFVSCDPETDEKAGGTAVEKMAGLWEVTVDVVDEQGNVLGKDPLGLGTININTYNTAANDADKMWLDDDTFYGVKMKVNVTDYNNGKFEGTKYILQSFRCTSWQHRVPQRSGSLWPGQEPSWYACRQHLLHREV